MCFLYNDTATTEIYILSLHDALPISSANARHYAQIVHETAILRGLIHAGGEIARLGWERPGETTDLVDRAEQILFDLSDRKSTRLNSSHANISYAVFCLKKKNRA